MDIKDLELIAKVKFWFGTEEDIFKKGLIIQKSDQFAYIYRPKLKKVM